MHVHVHYLSQWLLSEHWALGQLATDSIEKVIQAKVLFTIIWHQCSQHKVWDSDMQLLYVQRKEFIRRVVHMYA